MAEPVTKLPVKGNLATSKSEGRGQTIPITRRGPMDRQTE
jgi:hypothetical protein